MELVDAVNFCYDGVEDAAVVFRMCCGRLVSLVLRPLLGVAWIWPLAGGDGHCGCGSYLGVFGRWAVAWCVVLAVSLWCWSVCRCLLRC